MPSTLRASRRRTLWSLASLLPEPPERTLLHGICRSSVPGLGSTSVRRQHAEYDAAVVVVLSGVPSATWLEELGGSLQPGGRLLLAVRSGWSRSRGGPRLGVSTARLERLLDRSGYVVERTYGLRPSLVLPEYVVSLTPGVSTDFWANLFRPWSTAGAVASVLAAHVPAFGRRAFPWLVVRALWRGEAR